MTERIADPDPTDLDGLRRLLATSDAGQPRRPIGLGSVRIGSNALGGLVDEVATIRTPGAVVVVVDETPMRRAGADLKATAVSALGERFETKLAVIRAHGPELHADEHALDQAGRAIAGAGCVVAIGSGTITDIAKEASHRAGDPPLLVVQTAVSVNAFSDDMAVLLHDGVKRTVPSRWPTSLIVDLEVLADAPGLMNRAGFGELCSMFTAPADWYLATALGMADDHDPGIVGLFRDGADALLQGAARAGANEPEMLAELAARMTLTGIAMGVAGRTAPLSGTEHLFSHLLDMQAGIVGRPVALHGAQVGVASVLAATIWHDTLERLDPAALVNDRAFPGPSAVEGQVRATFDRLDPTGSMADECWSDVQRKLERWHGARPAIRAFAADWGRQRAALASMVARPERLSAALAAAGAPATVARLEPPTPADVARWALGAMPLMRDRFTVTDLRFFTGLWDDHTLDVLLARSGILGGAR